MPSIPLPDLLTMISVLVDDGHQPQTVQRHRATPEPKPALRVRETVAILLAMDRVPLPSERGFLAFLRVNHPTLFPQLPALSHVNRHARAVRGMVEHIRQSWLKNWAVADERQRIRDTKPVPVVGYKRTQTRSDGAGSASYGYCASRTMHACGDNLVRLTTIAGLPVADDLVPAHTDERDAAMRGLSQVVTCDRWADKGFLGEDWHDEVAEHQVIGSGLRNVAIKSRTRPPVIGSSGGCANGLKAPSMNSKTRGGILNGCRPTLGLGWHPASPRT